MNIVLSYVFNLKVISIPKFFKNKFVKVDDEKNLDNYKKFI